MKPDTIVALATGAGRAGVAVIRLSGPAAGATLSALAARDLPKPRIATREAFCDPRTGVSLDDGLALSGRQIAVAESRVVDLLGEAHQPARSVAVMPESR